MTRNESAVFEESTLAAAAMPGSSYLEATAAELLEHVRGCAWASCEPLARQRLPTAAEFQGEGGAWRAFRGAAPARRSRAVLAACTSAAG
jgi:hypothetical protein